MNKKNISKEVKKESVKEEMKDLSKFMKKNKIDLIKCSDKDLKKNLNKMKEVKKECVKEEVKVYSNFINYINFVEKVKKDNLINSDGKKVRDLYLKEMDNIKSVKNVDRVEKRIFREEYNKVLNSILNEKKLKMEEFKVLSKEVVRKIRGKNSSKNIMIKI